MGLRKAFLGAKSFLTDPASSFGKLRKQTLEEVLADYMILLLCNGLLAGATTFTYRVLHAVYLDIVRDVNINYWALLNINASLGVGIFFVTLFSGTFLVFLLALLLRPFTRGSKLTEVVKVTLASLSPTLLLGWINPRFVLLTFLWTGVLLASGLKGLRAKK